MFQTFLGIGIPFYVDTLSFFIYFTFVKYSDIWEIYLIAVLITIWISSLCLQS